MFALGVRSLERGPVLEGPVPRARTGPRTRSQRKEGKNRLSPESSALGSRSLAGKTAAAAAAAAAAAEQQQPQQLLSSSSLSSSSSRSLSSSSSMRQQQQQHAPASSSSMR
uniref:Uncharacterized protein n=1 Tax=Ananas comosus var. bracteatus TaxID=296719 RepID=A0A6V7NF76_ANACO|nr:unnamed protein product [Ananas comosus var. bracteatus]